MPLLFLARSSCYVDPEPFRRRLALSLQFLAEMNLRRRLHPLHFASTTPLTVSACTLPHREDKKKEREILITLYMYNVIYSDYI